MGWSRVVLASLAAAAAACAGDPGSPDGGGPDAPRYDAPALDTDTDAPSRSVARVVATSGGTLAMSDDGSLAFVADPARDRLHVVALGPRYDLAVDRSVELPRASEPGRVVLDGAGRVHVVLRNLGAIATIEPGGRTPMVRDVCAAPRGLAWDERDAALVVACADGWLVTLPVAGGPITRAVYVADDLRDVVIAGDRLLVSRFRSAEVLALDGDAVIRARYVPANATRPDALAEPVGDVAPTVEMEPHVAWRMIAAPGGAWLLHQRARIDAIPDVPLGAVSPRPVYGRGPTRSPENGCAPSMIEFAVSFVDPSAPSGVLGPSEPLAVATAIDLAASADGARIAVSAPRLRAAPCDAAMLDIPVAELETGAAPIPAFRGRLGSAATGTVALAYAPGGDVIALRDRPDSLDLVRWGVDGFDQLSLDDAPLPLAGGRGTFELVTESGLSCTSCHPEGGDDGHRWAFGAAGALAPAVRTQSVRGSVLLTHPFHWAGDLPDLEALIAEGFVRRMAGPALGRAEIAELAQYLLSVEIPPRPRGEPMATARGRTIFESPEAACSVCHREPAYTTRESLDVGTGAALQPATLLGAAYRAPYMRSGCAPTLRDVVGGDPACSGGALHVRTAHLSSSEMDDLVAYLRSL